MLSLWKNCNGKIKRLPKGAADKQSKFERKTNGTLHGSPKSKGSE